MKPWRCLKYCRDSHGLANEDPRCLHNVPMRDKNVFSIFTKKKENGSVHETPHARRYSLQHLFSSFSKDKVPLLEIKNQTYEKLRRGYKKVKPFKCQQGAVSRSLASTPLPPTGWDTSLLQCTTSIL